MAAFLLDVNVLIALIDPSHLEHDKVHQWFAVTGKKRFATCPLTENGLVRIVGNPKYPNSPGPPHVVLHSLNAIRSLPGHQFWPDELSITNEIFFSATMLSSHSRVTDCYLLALAQSRNGQLATLDHRLAAESSPSAKATLALL